MIAVVHAIDRPRSERAIGDHLAAGPGHPVPILRRHQERADRIDQHVHLDAGPAALRERLRGVGGGRPLLEDVLRVGDGLAGGPDHLELGREDLLAIQQHLDAVPSDHRAAGESDEGGPERGLRDPQTGQIEVRLDVGAAGQEDDQAGGGDDPPAPPPSHRAHSLRSTSMRSPVAGCVLRKPPPPSPSVFISQVSVPIMTSLLRPTRWSSSTP